jgi:hypothetical protein
VISTIYKSLLRSLDIYWTDKYGMTQDIKPITLPGINIRDDYSPTYNYALPLMQTDCWHIKLAPDWDQVIITAQQNSFWSQQHGTMRAWLSLTPNGTTVLPPEMRQGGLRLQGVGTQWCFYRAGLEPRLEHQVAVQFPIDPFAEGDGNILGWWWNVQNLSGQENAYYFQSTYSNLYATFTT